jgi:excisionase family DNA binding protein
VEITLKKTYTTGEAAKICGLSLTTIKRWIKKGALRIYKTPGGDIRIPHDQLKEFMREYDIPLTNMEDDDPKILVASQDRMVLKEIYRLFPQARIQIAHNDMDIGFLLSSFSPWVVILDEEGTEAEMIQKCNEIRRYVSPGILRIGVVATAAHERNYKKELDAVLINGGNVALFVEELIGFLIDGYEFEVSKIIA